MAGLAPPTLRLAGEEPPPLPDEAEILVEMADEPEDQSQTDERGNIVEIKHGDGSVTVSLDGRPLNEIEADNDDDSEWFANLATKIGAGELSGIADDLLRGIENDKTSRQEWVEARATGVKLLGLTIEVPSLAGASDGAPVEGMSRVRHPLLLEAVLRFQANARSELLPTDGPVKIRNDTGSGDYNVDKLANALELDLNHYLTAVATEYYPDTDRMLFGLGFQGTAFKKVYFCPLRNRPVSETVDAPDLIVNNTATDLGNAKRITHKVMLRPSTVKRLQILGVYRDISLSTPNAPQLNSLAREEKTQQGIAPDPALPDDRDREIYECYTELDIPGFAHTQGGNATGLEVPYRVTIDLTSREILSLVRNYDEPIGDELPMARKVFVKYPFVPGFGFYDIGLLHILGNTTNAATAAWRELLDAGMYANFPGFLVAKNGTRQNTNIFRVPPGGGAQVDTGGMPLRDAIMNLPYKEPSQALMGLVKDITEVGSRLGGTSETQVGEGNAEAPVGTTLAMIEQATKVMNSVHKRLHAAQAEEFSLLRQCFKENPESFWARGCKSGTAWDRRSFTDALNNCELVPQADPNTASHGQRVMKVMGLIQLSKEAPQLYNEDAIHVAALSALGWDRPEQFLATPEKKAEIPPEVQKAVKELQIKETTANAAMVEAQAKKAEVDTKIQTGAFAPKPDAPQGGLAGPMQQQDTEVDKVLAQAKMLDAQTKARAIDVQHQDTILQDDSRDADRESREAGQQMELMRDMMEVESNEKIAIARAQADKAAKQAIARAKTIASPKPKKGDA